MPVDPVAAAAPQARAAEDAAVARIVTRFSSEYVLRATQLMIELYGDVRTGLIALAINSANVAHLDVFSEEVRGAVTPDGILPDAMRRPISVARLADSASMPFESVRRTVQRLVDEGLCVRVEGGVIVPGAAVGRPQNHRLTFVHLGYVRKLMRDLQGIGLVEARAGRRRIVDAAAQDAADARIVARVSGEYLLRAVGLIAATYGDVRTGILVQTIVAANTGYLDARGGDGWRYAGIDENPPDELRRPISVARLAESLGAPFETKRRHVQGLIDQGICVRVEGGVIVPGVVLETPAAVQAMLTNVGYVRRFVRDLQGVGFDDLTTPRT